MSAGVLEQVVGQPEPPADQAPGRHERSRLSRVRAIARLAVRQVRRTLGTSALIVLLIALPIASLTAAVGFYESHQPTLQQKVTSMLGGFDAYIRVVGGPNPERRQDVGDEWSGMPSSPDTGEAPTGPPELPAGATITTVIEGLTPPVRTATGATSVRQITGEVWGPEFADTRTLLSGRLPTTATEIVATPDLLTRLDLTVGDTVTPMDATIPAMTITGVLSGERAGINDGEAVFTTDDSAMKPEAAGTRWFVSGWKPTLADVERLNTLGYGVYARDLVLNDPDGASTAENTRSRVDTYVAGLVIGVFLSVVVGLIAGAAMSVSARRQQRSLAMAASVGASRASLFGIVIGQGLALGLLAAVLGIGVGAGVLALMLLLLDRGESPNELYGSWGYHLPLVPLLGVAALAVVVALAAAALPAWTATRGDILGALRGARSPVRLAPSAPRWGLALCIVAVCGATAGITVLALNRNATLSPTLSTLVWTGIPFGIVGCIVLLLIGLGLSGHWFLTRIARAASHFGIASRLATRDLAANPSRTVPTMLAIGSALFVAVSLSGTIAVVNGAEARSDLRLAPVGSVLLAADGDTPANRVTAAKVGMSMANTLPGAKLGVIAHPAVLQWNDETGGAADPAQIVGGTGWYDGTCTLPSCTDGWAMTSAPPAVISVDDLATTTGIVLSEKERRDYLAGAAIVRWPEQVNDGHTRVFTLTAEAMVANQPGRTPADLSSSVRVPAIQRPDATTAEALIVAPQTAAAWGWKTVPDMVVATPTRADSFAPEVTDRLMMRQYDESIDGMVFSMVIEERHDPPTTMLAIITAFAAIVVIGTASVTLGLARLERRPDDATLTAVGGTSGVRRRLSAVQALVVVGGGSAIGGIGGLLVTLAIVYVSPGSRLIDVPWPWFLGIIVALPVVIAACAWLVKPTDPTLVRRTTIT